jgi:hypothetical protein
VNEYKDIEPKKVSTRLKPGVAKRTLGQEQDVCMVYQFFCAKKICLKIPLK